MEYNKGQIEAIKEAVLWNKRDNEQVFQLSGNPGTGKTVVLNAIIDAIGADRSRIAPMSYVGAAAINMRVKGMNNARTIHSWLYEPIEVPVLDKDGNPVMDTYYNRPKKRIQFVPRDLNGIDYFIIDEGGFVPYSMKKEIESRGIKIIVAGDIDQLPPVNDKPAYLYEGKVHMLTEIMRQNESSGIVYLSQRAKRGLPIHRGIYGNVMVIYENEMTDDMIRYSDAIICGRNTTRDKMNDYIRYNLKGIQSNTPVCGDRLICKQNNWGIEVDGINLVNGLTGTCMNTVVPTSFDSKGKTFSIDFMPDLLNSKFGNLNVDYKYFTSPFQVRKELKSSPYGVGEKFEFGYSITTHSAQGSEYNNGIYIEEPMSRDITNKLNFVGLTRFRNACIYVKPRPKRYY